MGHGWDYAYPAWSLKFMYKELGYVESIDDFNEPATNTDDWGSWLTFD